MRSCAPGYNYAYIGLFVLYLSVHTAPVLCQEQRRICADSVNPFNIPSFKVPPETDVGVHLKEELALLWIPREDLGCERNHNEDLRKKVNFTKSAFADLSSKLFVSERCQDFVKFWLDRTIKAVQNNLLVVLKVKSIRFFDPYQTFKRFECKNAPISMLPSDSLIQILDKTGQDLRNGLILSGNAHTPSFESYNDTFTEALRVYHGLFHALGDLRYVLINRVNGCEITDEPCLDQLYKMLIGEVNDWSGRVYGYVEIRKIIEDGIRLVRSYFVEGGSSGRGSFDGLKLPMVPPCFNT